MSSNLRLSVILSAVDNLTGPLRRIQGQLNSLRAPVTNVTREMLSLTKTVTALGVAGAGLGVLFVKTQLLDTAAQFEKFESILTTLEGSSVKAKQSMAWVSDFAARTPFQVGEVTDAFVKLRSYGLDPTKGLMQTLGDTAAAMGKPISQAVEAISDAITGENERLKELGITASVNKKDHETTFSWFQDGKTLEKTVGNQNKALLQSTLETIWNSKYKGAMEQQSKTWNGMMSNLEDQVTRTKVKIMEAGLFDWMKDKLGGFLALIDRMAADGSLQRWATDVGNKLQHGFEMGWAAGKKVYQFIQSLADMVGGFGNLAKLVFGAIAAIIAGPLLLALVGLGSALATLTLAFAANPILLAIVAIGAAIALVVLNWDTLVNRFQSGITNIASGFRDTFLGALREVISAISSINSAISNIMHLRSPFAGGAPMFAPSGNAVTPLAKSNRTDVGGQLNIKIDQEGRAKVAAVKSNNPSMMFNVDAGLTMSGAR